MTDQKNNLFLPSEFRLRFSMLSDWHIGSGTGRPGNVDSLVQRDADGLPYLPAKTVTGIWRDAAEQLAYGLDNGTGNGHWARLVELIFGNQPASDDAAVDKKPHGALLKPTSAHYSKNLRHYIQQKVEKLAQRKAGSEDEGERKKKLKSYRQQLSRQLQAAATFVKPGVSIDAATGQAKTKYLRFAEMGRKGAVLEADCVVVSERLKDEYKHLRPYGVALLIASVELAERIGGKRRRGAGRCRVSLAKIKDNDKLSSLDDAIKWLEKNADKLNLPEDANAALKDEIDNNAINFSAASSNDEWWSIPLTLKLKTPLAVTARTLGNVSETLDYLPGTYLLPHITRTLQNKLTDCRAAIVRGDIQVLPATIEVDGTRGLPVPLALFRHKSGGGFDKSKTVLNRLLEEAGDEQLKGYRDGYIGAYTFDAANKSGQLPTYKTTPKSLGTHNTVKDDVQRPTEEVGGVYSWEAIAGGAVLRSELRLRGDVKAELDDWLGDRKSEDLRLGSSSKDDYGLVTLCFGTASKLASNAKATSDNKLTVWLLSDVLLRQTSLRATTLAERLGEVLSEKLSVKLGEVSSEKLSVNLIEHPAVNGLLGSLVRARRVESWQVSWGLPRPSLLAMQAGSCVVFDVTQGTIAEEELKKLERTGIGERRAEGYGQLRFNDPLLTNAVNKWIAATKDEDKGGEPPSKTITLSSEDEELAQSIETEVWREELRRSILAFAADEKNRKEHLGWTKLKPPSSQLGGLRDALSRLRTEADKDKVLGWLNHLKETTNRKDKWNDGAISKIETLLNTPGKVWSLVDKNEANKTLKLTLTDGATERLKKELWAEAVRGLVDACVRAHKRDTE